MTICKSRVITAGAITSLTITRCSKNNDLIGHRQNSKKLCDEISDFSPYQDETLKIP